MADFDPFYFLQGGSEAGKIIRGMDWSATPLGRIENWPVSLRTAISTILNSHFPAAIVWGPRYITIYNDAFRPILGNKPEAMGRSFADIWSEVWQEIGPIAERAYRGEATFIEDFPLEVMRFGRPDQAFFTFCYSPLRDDKGEIAGMLDTVVETTTKVQAEQRAKMLNSELHHRIKNLLALVNSIVGQTLRRAVSVSEARDTLMQRLAALAGAHDILTGNDQVHAVIEDVVATALAPHGAHRDQFAIDGPSMQLSEKEALSLALALNELATNAIKYGALREPGGHIGISWDLQDRTGDEEFRFVWKEAGGPAVTQPARKGFGSMLVERVVPHDFGGTASLAYEPDGLRYEIFAARRQNDRT